VISVIIPLYNVEYTIGPCLTAVFASRHADYEVIVIDDGSRDDSVAIAAKFPVKLIRLQKNMGLSHARNIGATHAQYDILVFIDADVVIRQDTLTMIHAFFEKQADATGVVGLLDENCPHDDFFSQYKNLYMNFIFNKVSSPISFLYGSIHALRKKDFQPYDESLAYTEDTDLGQRLSANGKKIFLLKDLLVTHLKRYGFFSILKNDFRIPFYWGRLFFKYSDPLKLFAQKRFAHAGGSQISSILVAPAVVLLLVLSVCYRSVPLLMPGFLFLVFIYLNIVFFVFLFHKKGVRFTLCSIFFTFLDQHIMASGILVGTVHHLWCKKRWFKRIKTEC
jgi:glycosyltransferase involved in cell wall biosynthesis